MEENDMKKNTATAPVKAEEQAPEEQSLANDAIHSSDPPPFKDTLAELRKSVSSELIKQRPGARRKDGSREQFDYIEWFTAAEILDESAPSWSHAIKDIRQIGDILTVIVAITIDGVTREGLGTGNANNETGIKKAEHDALKRAAVKFGVARDLYKKELHAGQDPSYSDDRDWSPNPPANPMAHDSKEIATERQVNAIYAKGKYLKIDVDAACASVIPGVPIERLTKKAASWFITYLDNRPPETDESAPQSNDANVVAIGDRSSGSVSPETRGKLLFESGAVIVKDGGYTVEDNISGRSYKFRVTRDEDGTVRCECGAYKMKAHKGETTYRCGHIAAAAFYAAAKK
jgi:hypothetical protein